MPLFGKPGERIGYQVYEGPQGAHPLVLVHGFTASSASFLANVPGLCERYHVIAVELLGHGDSDAPEDTAAYAAEPAVERVLALLSFLGHERFLLCGHSLGGALALRIALDAPNRIAALVVINSMSAAGTPEWRERALGNMAAMAARIRADGVAHMKQTRLYPAHSKRLPPEAKEALVRDFDRLRPAGIAGTAEGLVAGVNSYERLPDLQVPFLLVVGDRDTDFVGAVPHFLAQLPPWVDSVTLPGAGHAANLEQPEAFNEAVSAFFDLAWPASAATLAEPLPAAVAEAEEPPAPSPSIVSQGAQVEEEATRGSAGRNAVLTVAGVLLMAGGIGLLALAFRGGNGNKTLPASTTAAVVAERPPSPSPTATPTRVDQGAGAKSQGPTATAPSVETVTVQAASLATPTTPPPAPATPPAPPPAVATAAPTATPTATPPPPTATPTNSPIASAAAIAGPTAVEPGQPATYRDVSPRAAEALTRTWQSPAGTTKHEAAITVTFPAKGCYTVSLTVFFSSGAQSTSLVVAVGGAACP
jgi:2-succinyl-6-hydroxy-2,4-cyclohexadiene-1-carboxylate synthase